LRHLGLLPTLHRLPHLEALELRVAEVERLVLAGVAVGGAERLGLGPGVGGGMALPYRVGRIERMVLRFRPSWQMELDEARHLVEMGLARLPDIFESGLGPLGDAEPVHGDVHRRNSWNFDRCVAPSLTKLQTKCTDVGRIMEIRGPPTPWRHSL